jgi:hypothetical protein
MKRVVTPLVVAAVLLAAGAALWMLGKAEQAVALQKTRLATLEFAAFDAVGDEPSDAGGTGRSFVYAARMPSVGTALTDAVRGGRATADYWRGRYADLTLERDAGGSLLERDPALLLLAANAAFRSAGLATADRDTALDRLDTIVSNYADVLKSSPGGEALVDAAYNYEFAVRMRSVLERLPVAKSPKAPPPPPKPAGPPPSIHGRPGGPPKDADANQFRVVIPKRSDERSNDPEGGQGGDRIKRG